MKGIHKVRRRLADGSVATYYYAWRGGPRIEAEPSTDAFWIEYWEHKRGATKRERLLSDLIDEFTESAEFKMLSQPTQRDYLYAYRLAKAHWPQLPVRLTQQRGFKGNVRKWLGTHAANPRKRDKLLFALSKVFSWAVGNEEIDRNPCGGIERLYNGTRRDEIWSDAQIKAFRANAAEHLLLVFELAIGTGQRLGDILRLTWKDYDGTHLTFEIGKSRRKGGPGKRVRVKVSTRLKKLLDGRERDTIRIAVNSYGRPWTGGGFQASWKKEKAKPAGRTFHDLRGTFITERWREGSSIEDIALITGHTIGEVRSILEKHYLSPDQKRSDAVILRMERNAKRTKL